MKVKNSQLLSFLMMIFFWNSANCQFIIDQGTFSGVWGLDMTYFVGKDVRIPAGKTLTIQKGITVKDSSGVMDCICFRYGTIRKERFEKLF